MKPPELPADEAARLRALATYEVLDTPPEPVFDGLTRLAAKLAEVPIALVSLVDAERQWFKSRHGLGATETPREVSFCGHVVAADAPLVVPDAHADVRFADNPLVTGEPWVRFYAGFPLRGTEGHVLGTLCVIDRRPRVLGPEQLADLELLAAQVTAQLELRRANLLLADAARRFRAIVDTALDAIVTCDASGRVVHANPATTGLLGYSPGEVVGRHIGEVLPVLAADARPGADRRVREVEMVRRDGSRFPAEVAVREYELEGARCVTGVLRDVSHRQTKERSQAELVAIVSHELRTPLTSIRGVLGLLAGGVLGELGEEAREFVGIALTNSDRAVRLVNDILDFEKLESRGVTFSFAAVDPKRVLEAALAANAAYAGASAVRLALVSEIPAGEVVVDADRLGQVLTNLISNAVKFSPAKATVEVSARARGGRVRIAVRDHGPGVPIEFRPRLFRRFAQASTSKPVGKAGSGLGLAISKALIDRMGGVIGYEPAEDGGSIFWFELPLLPAVEVDAPTAARAILVCEAEPEAWTGLTQQAAACGFEVEVAPTLERARRLGAGRRHDAVVLDLALADGSGAALLWELRGAEATRTVPVVVMSAGRATAEPAGLRVVDLVVRPFERRRVVAAIGSAVEMSTGGCHNVLCAVDDPEAHRAAREALPPGWTVSVVTTAEATEAALREEEFDVVLLDLSLPDGGADEVIPLIGGAQTIVFARESATELCGRLAAALRRPCGEAMSVTAHLAALAATARRP